MENTTPRLNLTSLVAACIVAAGLIASALIVAHRPASAFTSAVPGAASTAPLAVPPITQDAAWEQFRAQVLAAPKLNTVVYNHVTYTLSDVKQSPELSYSAKDDDFIVLYDLVWQPTMPSGGPQSGSANLTNNGYGHYYGLASFNLGEDQNSQYAYVTIK